MALYTPPNKDDNDGNAKPRVRATGKGADKPVEGSEQFYARPSIGLKLWGPLVPSSDNRTGLWTLVGIQSAIGVLCIYRFRGLRNRISLNQEQLTQLARSNIAEIPSLNRFSSTNTDKLPKANAFSTIRDWLTKSPLGKSKITGGNLSWRYTPFSSHSRFNAFKQILYLFTGSIILLQSILETCRLTLLKYDPWAEEARSVRDKKFFNDIVKFYYEGIDPNKIKVKDATSGNTLPINLPEIKQSVALVRAQAEAENPLIKWFGPIEYKPMSFTKFLDKLEYHLEMLDKVESRRLNLSSKNIRSKIAHSREELENLIAQNRVNRSRDFNNVKITEKSEIYSSTDKSTIGNFPTRGVIMGPEVKSADKMDFEQMWTLHNPWMGLALDTSLSIRFLPTVIHDDDIRSEQERAVDTSKSDFSVLNGIEDTQTRSDWKPKD